MNSHPFIVEIFEKHGVSNLGNIFRTLEIVKNKKASRCLAWTVYAHVLCSVFTINVFEFYCFLPSVYPVWKH